MSDYREDDQAAHVADELRRLSVTQSETRDRVWMGRCCGCRSDVYLQGEEEDYVCESCGTITYDDFFPF